jgi:site-specific DNA-methyltransferase (adenine-specific)
VSPCRAALGLRLLSLVLVGACLTDILLGDGIAGMHGLSAGSVDLVLSDLPSGETAAEFDRAPDLAALFAATWHALKPDGVAVFMASSLRFAAACMAAGGNAYRYDLVWEKALATGHLNSKHRPLRAHEFVLVFQCGRGCFVPQMTESGVAIRQGRTMAASENYQSVTSVNNRQGATDRYPRSVLHFAGVSTHSKDRVHPQQKPDDLLRWIIRSYSRPGEGVIDPFAGSGSTGHAALSEGRNFLGFDSSSRFAPRGVFA